jgi:hypothetical protein
VITELHTLNPDIEDSTELEEIRGRWERELAELHGALARLPAEAPAPRRAQLQLEIGDRQARLGFGAEAWKNARRAFDVLAAEEDWERAAQACDVLFRAEQPDSVIALGHGVWLGVTYPIDPRTTVALLQHVVDETPPDSNVAAVAATTAHYIAAVRGEGRQGEELSDFTEQLWLLVAGNQGISGQNEFAGWVYHNHLQEPSDFLPRMSEAVDNMVRGNWWIDRDALRAKLPSD